MRLFNAFVITGGVSGAIGGLLSSENNAPTDKLIYNAGYYGFVGIGASVLSPLIIPMGVMFYPCIENARIHFNVRGEYPKKFFRSLSDSD